MQDKQQTKEQDKRDQLEKEIDHLRRVQKEMVVLNEKEAEMQLNKRKKLLEGIDLCKAQRDQKDKFEKVSRLNQKPEDYFPYTHGDHIERQRELMNEELKEDLVYRL